MYGSCLSWIWHWVETCFQEGLVLLPDCFLSDLICSLKLCFHPKSMVAWLTFCAFLVLEMNFFCFLIASSRYLFSTTCQLSMNFWSPIYRWSTKESCSDANMPGKCQVLCHAHNPFWNSSWLEVSFGGYCICQSENASLIW